jgi:hypothetical protein
MRERDSPLLIYTSLFSEERESPVSVGEIGDGLDRYFRLWFPPPLPAMFFSPRKNQKCKH